MCVEGHIACFLKRFKRNPDFLGDYKGFMETNMIKGYAVIPT